MSAEPTVNFNIQGNVNQAAAKIENSNSHIGDVNNYGNQIPTVDEVLDTVLQAIPEESREEIANEVIEPMRTEIQALAAMPIAEAEAQKQSFMNKSAGWAQKLLPFAAACHPKLMAFGEVALSAVPPPSSWVVSALLAAVKAK